MTTAEAGFVELPDTCSVAEALEKYSGRKSWLIAEVKNHLLALLC